MKTDKMTLRQLLEMQFELELSDVADDKLMDVLADRIANLLMHQMESFMSMMYRLDVPEHKVSWALSPENPEPPNVTLAKLVIDRQLQRMKTKQKYTQEPLDDWMTF